MGYVKNHFMECFALVCGGSSYHTVRELLEEEFKLLVTHYGESQRHYHTLGHIEECLLQYDRYAESLGVNKTEDSQHRRDKCIIILAIFYHDIVYDPKSSMNEGKLRFNYYYTFFFQCL